MLQNIPKHVSKILKIDLSAISHNYKEISKFVSHTTENLCSIKSQCIWSRCQTSNGYIN